MIKIQENIPLAQYTTFKIGGKARYFCVIGDAGDLRQARSFAEKKNVPIFILGGGSNILVSDEGFPGLVVKNEIKGIFYEKQADGKTLVTVGAGENWDTFVADTISHNLGGLENLSGIPGTVGASPVQNIGAYGREVRSTIYSLTAIDQTTGEEKIFSQDECVFGYRNSFFKTPAGKKWIITQVCFLLDSNEAISIEYKDLTAYFSGRETAKLSRQDVRDAVLAIRFAKLPELKNLGTAGSFFKNVTISKEQYDDLKKKWPDLPGFELPSSIEPPQLDAVRGASEARDQTVYAYSAGTNERSNEEMRQLRRLYIKVPLAWILDNICGFKGLRVGEVGVYKNQALVLINYGKGTASDIASLAESMQKKVYEMTGITIEPEVEYIFPEKAAK
jgi:UDP-N-acetylmuramate dehydrogenase